MASLKRLKPGETRDLAHAAGQVADGSISIKSLKRGSRS
jgi:hypothetical protein